MFASLLRQARRDTEVEHSPFSTFRDLGRLRPGDDEADGEEFDFHDNDDYDDGEEGEGDRESEPLLPIFSAEVLDRLPVYDTTHNIRLLVVRKCETTLSWDQLRSPQVSQFMVKPVQQQILDSHFSRATLYALLANCLQFQKEGQTNPGNVGVCMSRAMMCQLLAMRLLKEYSTRELIDALLYDFDPLRGVAPPTRPGNAAPSAAWMRARAAVARISTIEIAIRAQAKKFLAHPLIVEQLEAVWAGTIVFHSAADHLHRKPEKAHNPPRFRSYGAVESQPDSMHRTKQNATGAATHEEPLARKSVTLYDPREASLFKLSRLRVPRYRQFFSTCSYAIMLGLFLAVLVEKPRDITALEVVFWFWSAGFMLDEVVGFSEQGFGLYIMSVWNAIDLGILLLFVTYYVLRLYSIIVPDLRKHRIARAAYDVLASTAVLLFPRLFSALDHYRYFSQLLIAFRMMALDLIAILLLITISCSGFFVAFTLSFSDDIPDAGSAAYALFQMLMGFTPAAWEIWDGYNILGKALLTLFLIICHFLIVTILITVLTNSFMEIVRNADEEHQFLFAVNTISMVKSDALFSYIAPANVMGWLLTPLRYTMAFRRFVKLNRNLTKATHFPILFSIFAYERLALSRHVYEPADLVEQRGRGRGRGHTVGMHGANEVFSPARIREPSVATFRKDRALEEVFRRPFRGTVNENNDGVSDVRKSSNVVRDWMNGVGQEGGAVPPDEQPQSVVDRLETRRPRFRRTATAGANLGRVDGRRQFSAGPRSVASEPDDGTLRRRQIHDVIHEEELARDAVPRQPGRTDAEGDDGDDELVTNDEEEIISADSDREKSGATPPRARKTTLTPPFVSETDISGTPRAARVKIPPFPPGTAPPGTGSAGRASPTVDTPPIPVSRRRQHNRTLSTNTILFSPQETSRSSSPHKPRPQPAAPPTGRRTPKRLAFPPFAMNSALNTASSSHATRPQPQRSNTASRAAIPPRQAGYSPPDFDSLLALGGRDGKSRNRREPSFSARALDLASDIGDNRYAPDVPLALPASFSTQLERAGFAALSAAVERQRRRSVGDDGGDSSIGGLGIDGSGGLGRGGGSGGGSGGGGGGSAGTSSRPGATSGLNHRSAGQIEGRILMARMGALEQGIREVVREVKGLTRGTGGSAGAGTPTTAPGSAAAGQQLSRANSKRSSLVGDDENASPASGAGAAGQKPARKKAKSAAGPSAVTAAAAIARRRKEQQQQQQQQATAAAAVEKEEKSSTGTAPGEEEGPDTAVPLGAGKGDGGDKVDGYGDGGGEGGGGGGGGSGNAAASGSGWVRLSHE